MKRIRYGILGLLIWLSACGNPATNTELQGQLLQQETLITNYHLTLKKNETKKGEVDNVTQVVANAAVWSDGTGYGTRIDKINGKATNQMEVVATQNAGAIRYYQDPWEETVSGQSSLQNVIIFPYHNILQFANELTEANVANWTVDGQLQYSGEDSKVRQSLKFLNLQASENSQIDVKIEAGVSDKQVHRFELRIIEKSSNIVQEYMVQYHGVNQQQMRVLPVK